MSRIIKDLIVPVGTDLESVLKPYASGPNFVYRILKKSLDARQRHTPRYVYTIEIASSDSLLQKPQFQLPQISQNKLKNIRPIIVGAGPAGLFAALRLCEAGASCVLIERGSMAEDRIKKINRFWRYNELDPNNNVGFGEGGAGLYSDGKLITRIKSPHIPYVMDRLIRFGAPEEIRYLANPHVGSDRIRRVIPKLRQFLIENGCKIFYDTEVTSLQLQKNSVIGVYTKNNQNIQGSHVILAPGHSADELLEAIQSQGVYTENKSYAMGIRIEHPQSLINQIQYRSLWELKELGAANYKLTHHNKKEDYGVYSFCMCPGGYVLNSSTHNQRIVSNGMSNFTRNSPWANSAVVVSVDNSRGQFDLKYRQKLENKAAALVPGGAQLPAQRLKDFLNQKLTLSIRNGSSPSGALAAPVHESLDASLFDRIAEGLESFAKKIPNFIHDEAQVYALESRTSSPLRITRDAENLMSLSHKNLYPCGEGAGYAGGITSAACDGIEVVDQVLKSV